MKKIEDPYLIKVDVRYLEFLLNVIKEQRDLINGKFNDKHGERLYRMKIHDKAIQQLKLIIRQHKREFRI